MGKKSTSTSTSTSTNAGSGAKSSSHNQTVSSGWGSRSNFQHSYGLDMSPDGLQEGTAILNAFDRADKAGSVSTGGKGKK